ncbi:MAG TPA: metalloregulator ArsR/SmtB family transcription factor [Gammaproteobacteria bacterium]
MVEDNSGHLDTVFRALADPTRRAMLRELSLREHSVGELAAPHSMSLAAASKHLKVLENAGLVERRITGRTHRVRLAPARLAEAREWLDDYERFWTRRLDALDKVLREPD